MKVAVHNSGLWNLRWAEYCKKFNIDCLVFDFYSSDIIEKLKINKITHVMWHFSHLIPKDIFMARNVLFSVSKLGIETFPSFDSAWHFDDKVSQKYLLEAIDAPMINSYAFYDKEEALFWIKSCTFPLVAKLRRGAGSYNVVLLRDKYEGKKYISKMFGKGLRPTPGLFADVNNKLRVAKNLHGIKSKIKKIPNFLKMVTLGRKGFPREKGYVYFQDFIPNNDCDYRIIVIGDIAYGMRRMVRKGDFRASGSGMYDYDGITEELIKIAFDVSSKLNMLSVAFDFVYLGGKPLIVEISYGFGTDGSSKCKMYWHRDGRKIEGNISAEEEIIKYFLKHE